MATTLLNARDRCKQQSDNVNASFLSDPEWNNLIGDSYVELYGLLATQYGEDYLVGPPFSITTDGTNNLFALPSDLFKLLGVDLQVQSSALWVTLKPFMFAERNSLGLVNTPAPMAGQTVRLWYVPSPPAFDSDNDTLPTALLAYDEYIIADAVIKALAKEESDVSVFMARKQQIIERINGEASNRDAGSPTRIVDYYRAPSVSMRYRLNGSNIWLSGGNTPVLPYGDAGLGGWGWE